MKLSAYILVLGVMLATSRAYAAPPDDAAETSAARARFNEGVKLYGAGKYELARIAFLQAYALRKQPTALFNLGQASLRAGRPLDAVHAFEQFLREAEEATPEQRQKAEKGITEAQKGLARIEVDAPAGADVTVDGTLAGHAPLAQPLWVLPGKHEVKLVAGDAQATESVKAIAGATARVRLAKPKTQEAKVVTRDQEPTHAATPAPKPIPEVQESAGPFAPPDSVTPSYVAGFIGVAGFTGAVIFGSLDANARKTRADAEDAIVRVGQQPDAICGAPPGALAGACRTYVQSRSDAGRYQTAFIISLVTGAVGVTTAFAWYFLAPKAKPESTSIVPVVGPSVAGASIEGRF